MRRRRVSLSILFLSSALAAQDPVPGPAPDVAKFAPLLGSWSGTGTARFGPDAPTTKWTARGTYRWCLDAHWLQEDFTIDFEGMPTPLVMRGYYGFDRETGRHVVVNVTNNGVVQRNDLTFLPDGTMVQVLRMDEAGAPYCERSLFKLEGDEIVHSVDLLMPQGPSLTIVEGRMKRATEAFDGAWDTKPFQPGEIAEPVTRLARSAGTYDLAGEVLMAPGAPPMKIRGTDAFRPVFGGLVLHGTTTGSAEGVPGTYRGDVFWAFDKARKCLVAAYVSNMGEVATMDAWFVDGKLVSTSHGTMRGTPMVQRMVMEMDAEGRPSRVLSHSCVGDKPPFESFRATYTKK